MKPELFEELLTAYPAEKRDLARQVYCRFSEGDSTQFFTQLFIVLDLYAVYAEGIPQVSSVRTPTLRPTGRGCGTRSSRWRTRWIGET